MHEIDTIRVIFYYSICAIVTIRKKLMIVECTHNIFTSLSQEIKTKYTTKHEKITNKGTKIDKKGKGWSKKQTKQKYK